MIIAFCPVWGRHKILRVWAEGIIRLRDMVDITPVLIVSSLEDSDFIKNYIEPLLPDTVTVFTNNQPLGNKQNKGLQAIRDMDWDYLCQISSDLLLTDKGMEELLDNPTDVTGFSMAYFINTVDGVSILFKKLSGQKSLGACRMISRDVIHRCNYTLWNDSFHNNLDRSSQERMGDVDMKVIDKPLVVGIKSDIQITPFKILHDLADEVDTNKAISGLGESEIEMINNLINEKWN